MQRNAAILAIALLGIASVSAAEPTIEFNRDIRPILSDKCFGCHGPDSGHRKAGLRLDVREAAMKEAKSGEIPLKPGDPDGSDLLVRMLSDDPDEIMPPPEAKLPKLTKKEIDLVRRWIAQGAEYQPHWSFISIPTPATPPTEAANPQARNDLDRVAFHLLKKRRLQPRPEAKPETLLRRVSLDITGLPPSPESVRAFLADPAPDKFERAVERLLASPAYGERMTSDWLDIARYADSYGFQVDHARHVWPWRDWVVKAYNENLPFDQFVTWQLAGDLLPNPTQEQIIATAFNRLHQQESEGGSIEEEYRVEYVNDRVTTFGTAFLGLTFECNKCHDHKFDPLSQKEFYQIFAFFDDIDEAGLYSYYSPQTAPTPALVLSSEKQNSEVAQLQKSLLAAEAKVTSLRAAKTSDFQAWLQSGVRDFTKIPGEISRFTFDALSKERSFTDQIDAKASAKLASENKLVPGRSGKGVQFSGDDSMQLPVGAFNRADPFTISLWIQSPDSKERAVIFHRSVAWTDSASRGFELILEDGRLKWSLIRFWPGDAASIKSRSQLNTGEWVHVTVSSDGSGKASGLRLYVNGAPADCEVIRDSLSRDIAPVGKDIIQLAARERDRGFKRGSIDDIRIFNRELTPLEIRTSLSENPSNLEPEASQTELFETFLATSCEEYSTALAELKTARNALLIKLGEPSEIMVMHELPTPKKAYVLFRGQYDQRREEVFADTPAVLNPFPKDAPRNRLGLAKWLTDPSNPLLARVTVNRIWQGIFGRGLVRTADDFGSQGSQPEYPELLDWLAGHFIKNKWDTKHLIRTIVTSHLYRQESAAQPNLLADDPDNALLARGPRFRASAEMIRDTFLQSAGLLDPRMGGAPVRPYEIGDAFKPEAIEQNTNLYRRSLYSLWRRTSPPPAMVSFDASRRAVCSARRERTNTPLQSLILLNGPQYVEAARVLGTKLHTQFNGQLPQMIEEAFLICLSRMPLEKERRICEALYNEQLAYFAKNRAEAESLLKVGRHPAEKSIAPEQAAAATVLAQALLNHDGSVVKQ